MDETGLYLIMFYSDVFVACCYNAFFGFTNSSWHERFNVIADNANDCPTTSCSNFSNDLIELEILCTNCKKHFMKSISIKFHCFSVRQ